MSPLKWINSRFEILSPLGSGSSSKIYKAIDRKDPNENIVALKILSQLPHSNSQYLQEFFHREVRSLSSLNHPRIIRLIDHGVDVEQQVLYLALEYLERAASLRERIKAWSPEVSDVLDMIMEILDGLSYAHQSYIIHRDINPSNILLDGSGNIKIIDFGISKILGTLHAGETVGEFFTRAYASPEQVAYQDVDYSTDIYSVAGIAYFMFTKGDPNPSIPLARQINEVIKLPSEIKTILSRMADPNPDLRFESALQTLLAFKGSKNRFEAQTQRIYLQLTQSAIKNLYDQTVIKRQTPEDAKAVVQAALDSGEVYVARVPESSEDTYDIVGDGISLRCKLGGLRGGEYFSLVAVSIQTFITPHQLEKARHSAYPLHANWKIGQVQDPVPTNISGLSFLADQIDNFINTKLRESDVKERRADLVEGWMNILELDREIKGATTFRVDYLSWRLQEENHVVAVQIKGDINMEDMIPAGQLLMMSTHHERNIPVGHFLRQDGKTVFLSRLRDCDTSLISKAGTLVADERQWAAAWRRQRNALITIINGRCVNPRLPDILLDPTQASTQVLDDVDKFRNPDLDDHKKQVVNQALNAKDLFLIQGPPGTGKTVIITEIIAQVLARNPKTRILLVSQSNVAVDHVLQKVANLVPEKLMVRIGKEEYVSAHASGHFLEKKLKDWSQKVQDRAEIFLSTQYTKSELRSNLEFHLDLVKQLLNTLEKGSRENSIFVKESDVEDALQILRESFQAVEISYNIKSLNSLSKLISSDIDKQRGPLERTVSDWIKRLGYLEDFEDAYLEVCSIVAGTCVGIAGKKNLPERFDLTIVDEAGRATPSELLIPMVRSEKCILVGDHKQLPPVFDFDLKAQVKNRREIDPIWLEQSLFEYLFLKIDQKLKTTLKTQYRMHPYIANLVSNVFYKDEGLETGILTHERAHGWEKWTDPIIWCSTSQLVSRFESSDPGGSKYNLCEVNIILNELRQLEKELEKNNQSKSVAVISGYAAQVEQLKNQIEPTNGDRWKFLRIEINTVDAFQGREEDFVFYSVVRSNKTRDLGFLADFRRLNVALSRAREFLYIIGDHRMLVQASTRQGNPFKEVIAHILDHAQECTLKELVNEQP